MQDTVRITDQTFRIPALTRRFVASLIDYAFMGLLFLGFGLGASFADSVSAAPALGVLLLLAIPLYHPVSLAATGTTIGKTLLGMHVIRVLDAAKPGFGAALGRWLLFQVVPLGQAIAWIGALSDEANRGFHDKGAGTIVVMR